ncbi:Copper amine oxidase 1 [Diaporthe amygdali]|uniref:Copper amine oxidase 1 n=1 Tax=Phomopsis amygdali TaxID=1214568 RepID=UPI0022FDDD53|nr:Copper amine oxidase 1 [Diaporthe amygdali]KAJ0109372.1 Copper amine oxidase 1 [Diaporthe amygdali]
MHAFDSFMKETQRYNVFNIDTPHAHLFQDEVYYPKPSDFDSLRSACMRSSSEPQVRRQSPVTGTVLGGTSRAGFLVKKPSGFSITLILSDGITGKSSGLGLCVSPNVCQSTMSVSSTLSPQDAHSERPVYLRLWFVNSPTVQLICDGLAQHVVDLAVVADLEDTVLLDAEVESCLFKTKSTS